MAESEPNVGGFVASLVGVLLVASVLMSCEKNAGEVGSPYPALQQVEVGGYFQSEWSGQHIRYNGQPSAFVMSFSVLDRAATNLYFAADVEKIRLGRCLFKIHEVAQAFVRIEYYGGCDAYQKR